MDVVLAHPEGYEVFEDVEKVAKENAEKSGGSFTKTNDMAEAFKDADIVYPKSWAPFAAMEKRTELYGNGDFDGIAALEKELLAREMQNTKTGLVPKNLWQRQKTEKRFICTVCRLTSQA